MKKSSGCRGCEESTTRWAMRMLKKAGRNTATMNGIYFAIDDMMANHGIRVLLEKKFQHDALK